MADVHQLRPLAEAAQVRKQEFLDCVADAYQRYMDDEGIVPDAIAVQIGGMAQRVGVQWNVAGSSEAGGAHAFLCKAQMALIERLVRP